MNAHRNADALTVADGRNVLTMARDYPQPPSAVWAALTEPAALSQWFPFQVDLDPRPGGTIAFGAPVSEVPLTTGTVTAVAPRRLFAFNWGADHLSWTVTADGEGSRLTLEHTFDDRAGAPSFAAGWDLCMAALGRLLDGGPVEQRRDGGESHDAYVHLFGLDRGTVTAVGDTRTVRFERQLVGAAERVWETLAGGIEPVPGLPVPVGFTDRDVPAGHVTEVRPPHFLSYEWTDGGTVTWDLREGTGYGARLVLTQTGPKSFDTDAALAAWHTRIEDLAARLRGR
ncbi:SRPBCC family protein [Streptomyces sp. 8L]|uniref:SRPBCC family protein n=1 Tax=Streptomyces sp. 8L TaxID=2877242 RepID=UPI001CD53216|nr:SRPBCC family protein [Streptomyces sp. 8L]MCA1223723.1 SRPBCC domain-containing protein [Streptomyces sp. 8L]